MRKKYLVASVVSLCLTLWLAMPKHVQSSHNPGANGQAAGVADDNAQLVRSWPPDTTSYQRLAIPEDYLPGGQKARMSGADLDRLLAIGLQINITDVVVSNTDPNQQNINVFSDSEPSIATNRDNPSEIVITAFSGFWGINIGGVNNSGPLWHSTDGGSTWTKEVGVPPPPGVGGTTGCPCDQTVDYGIGSLLAGTFLTARPTNVFSGTTTNPANVGPFWNSVGGVAQATNLFGINSADQPWLLVNAAPGGGPDNIYVAYDDFSVSPVNTRVAVAPGPLANPPNGPSFTIDNQSGFSTGAINPGHRLAVDSSSGAVYSLFQQCVANCASLFSNPKTIDYVLNRSTDGGATWGLNGSATGVVVATGLSSQPNPKFGSVNALLGGVDHVAVDPQLDGGHNFGDVYVVGGDRDSQNVNRLSIVRLVDNGAGGLVLVTNTRFFSATKLNAALPSVAVTTDPNHTVGVLYDTFDGIDGIDPKTGRPFPIFSVHLALSFDRGSTFPVDIVLERFVSPASGNIRDPRQRVLGDYQQLKALGNTFYGVFSGNGVPFGRPTAHIDPIFVKVTVM